MAAPVEEAVKLNQNLMGVNKHQQCVIVQLRHDTTSLKAQLMEARAAGNHGNEDVVEKKRLKDEAHSLKVRISTLEMEKDSTRRELESCKENLQATLRSLKSAQGVIRQLQQDNTAQDARLESLQDRVNRLNDEREDLKSKQQEATRSAEEARKTYEETEMSWNQKVAVLEGEVKEVRGRLKASEVRLEAAHDECGKLTSRLEETATQLAGAQAVLNVERTSANAQTDVSSFMTSSSAVQTDPRGDVSVGSQVSPVTSTVAAQTFGARKDDSSQTERVVTSSSTCQTYVASFLSHSAQTQKVQVSPASTQTDVITADRPHAQTAVPLSYHSRRAERTAESNAKSRDARTSPLSQGSCPLKERGEANAATADRDANVMPTSTPCAVTDAVTDATQADSSALASSHGARGRRSTHAIARPSQASAAAAASGPAATPTTTTTTLTSNPAPPPPPSPYAYPASGSQQRLGDPKSPSSTLLQSPEDKRSKRTFREPPGTREAPKPPSSSFSSSLIAAPGQPLPSAGVARSAGSSPARLAAAELTRPALFPRQKEKGERAGDKRERAVKGDGSGEREKRAWREGTEEGEERGQKKREEEGASGETGNSETPGRMSKTTQDCSQVDVHLPPSPALLQAGDSILSPTEIAARPDEDDDAHLTSEPQSMTSSASSSSSTATSAKTLVTKNPFASPFPLFSSSCSTRAQTPSLLSSGRWRSHLSLSLKAASRTASSTSQVASSSLSAWKMASVALCDVSLTSFGKCNASESKPTTLPGISTPAVDGLDEGDSKEKTQFSVSARSFRLTGVKTRTLSKAARAYPKLPVLEHSSSERVVNDTMRIKKGILKGHGTGRFKDKTVTFADLPCQTETPTDALPTSDEQELMSTDDNSNDQSLFSDDEDEVTKGDTSETARQCTKVLRMLEEKHDVTTTTSTRKRKLQDADS